jgi:hypothetical protein
VFNGVDERKLLPAIVVSFCLFLAGLILLASGLGGCAVRHLPGGGTQQATRFEQVLAWNASLAQANDGFAENVIALQRGGIVGIAEAKNILVGEAKIAEPRPLARSIRPEQARRRCSSTRPEATARRSPGRGLPRT